MAGLRNLGDLLDDALGHYRRDFLFLLALSALTTVPSTLLSVALTVPLPAWYHSIFLGSDILQPFVGQALTAIASAALCVAISSQTANGARTLSSVFRFVVKRLQRLLQSVVLATVATDLLLITFIGAPVGFYLQVRWFVLIPVAMFENEPTGIALLRRSDFLTKGTVLRIFVVLLVETIAIDLPSLLLARLAAAWWTTESWGLPFGIPRRNGIIVYTTTYAAVSSLVRSAISLVTLPFLVAVMFVLYQEVSVHREPSAMGELVRS